MCISNTIVVVIDIISSYYTLIPNRSWTLLWEGFDFTGKNNLEYLKSKQNVNSITKLFTWKAVRGNIYVYRCRLLSGERSDCSTGPHIMYATINDFGNWNVSGKGINEHLIT